MKWYNILQITDFSDQFSNRVQAENLGRNPGSRREPFMIGMLRSGAGNQREQAAMKCLRIYASPDGESHFDEVELPTAERSVHPDAMPFAVSDSYEASRVRLTRIPAGMREVTWHTVEHTRQRPSVSPFHRGANRDLDLAAERPRFAARIVSLGPRRRHCRALTRAHQSARTRREARTTRSLKPHFFANGAPREISWDIDYRNRVSASLPGID